MANKSNTQKQATKASTTNVQVAHSEQSENHVNRVIDRTFEAGREFAKNDPKTAKRVVGTTMICGGVGIAIGGAIMIGSTF